MVRSDRMKSLLRPGVWAAVLLVPAMLSAADRNQGKPLPEGELVDVFSAIDAGKIDVQLIAKDASKCRLIVTNKTDKPLNVMLPQAFAGVPVLAQFQDFNQPNFNQNNVPQRVGAGPNLRQNNFMNPGMMNIPNMPNQNGRGQNMFPGPMFNIAPEKVGRFKFESVCLDYGKPDPKPQLEYEIKPIGSCIDKPGVAEVCAMLGRGEISRRAAQLAAWHLNNDMSWEKLAGIRQKATFGTKASYTRKELEAAKQAAEKAVKKGKKPNGSKADSRSGG